MGNIVKKTVKDYGLFNGDKYTYPEVKLYKDGDSRLSRQDSWCIKQHNDRMYLTTLQIKQLLDMIDQALIESGEKNDQPRDI